MADKVGVIIQGPLISFGQGPNKCIGGFQTYQTIKKNIESFRKLRMKYVVCTWVPLEQSEIRAMNMLKKDKVNLLVIETPKLLDPDHRYKHHFAVKAGFDYLMKEDIDFAINIRTDMYIPESIFVWLLEQMKLAPDKFVISELYDDGITVGDFLYSANVKAFNDFLISILRHRNFSIHPSVGADIGVKFLSKKNNITFNFLHLPVWIYYIFFLLQQKKYFILWREFVYNSLSALPRELWEDIIWRGKKMSDVMDSSHIFFYENIVNRTVQAETLSFKRTLLKYESAMSSYYMKRINKNLRKLLLKLKSIYVRSREIFSG